jgi:hypothetical protein
LAGEDHATSSSQTGGATGIQAAHAPLPLIR